LLPQLVSDRESMRVLPPIPISPRTVNAAGGGKPEKRNCSTLTWIFCLTLLAAVSDGTHPVATMTRSLATVPLVTDTVKTPTCTPFCMTAVVVVPS